MKGKTRGPKGKTCKTRVMKRPVIGPMIWNERKEEAEQRRGGEKRGTRRKATKTSKHAPRKTLEGTEKESGGRDKSRK